LFRSFAEAADFSKYSAEFPYFCRINSVRQNRHYRNLDAELIDFIKRYEKLRHLI
jgi:hypothetical protein